MKISFCSMSRNPCVYCKSSANYKKVADWWPQFSSDDFVPGSAAALWVLLPRHSMTNDVEKTTITEEQNNKNNTYILKILRRTQRVLIVSKSALSSWSMITMVHLYLPACMISSGPGNMSLFACWYKVRKKATHSPAWDAWNVLLSYQPVQLCS